MAYIRKGYCTHELICTVCGERYKGQWNSKSCNLCRKERKKNLYNAYGFTKYKNLPTGTVGSIQELKVSIDLMGKGFDVFRSLSPNACCDLLALKNGKQFDIEVRTAWKNISGKPMYTKANIMGKYRALVIGDEIIYEPPLEID